MDEQTETKSSADPMDRRSAIKKAAVAGAIVWAVPVVASTNVSAQATCTLKCAGKATSGVAVLVRGEKLSCEEIPGAEGAPGRVTRIFRVDGVSASASLTCPCDPRGAPVVTLTPDSQTTFTFIDTLSNQGRRDVLIGTIKVSISCKDRQGRVVVLICSYELFANFSGSCEGEGNTGFSVGAATNCTTTC